MASLNKVMLIGHAGKDAETKQVGDNTVTNFSLATSESYTNKAGEKVENTEWHNIVMWNKGKVSDFIKKGTQLYVEGKIKTRSYEVEGVKKYMTEIFVDFLQLLGKKEEGSTQSAPPPQSQPAKENTPPPGNIGGEDDLPF